MINVKPLQIVSTRAWFMFFEVIVQHGVQKARSNFTFKNVFGHLKLRSDKEKTRQFYDLGIS